MALNGKVKGKAGELEACHTLRELFGWIAKRSQQYSGWAPGGNSPDIVCDNTPDLFYEVKRVERLNVQRAMVTAMRQSARKCPVLLHRTNRSKAGWLLTIRLEDLPRLAHAYAVASDSETQAHPAMATEELPG